MQISWSRDDASVKCLLAGFLSRLEGGYNTEAVRIMGRSKAKGD